ncbi:MAG: NAD-dependent epimerase/dehydratase family protein [Promethearchaeota archaeon]
MKKKMPIILLTGASGNVGFSTFKELLKTRNRYNIRLLLRGSSKNKKLFKPFLKDVEIIWGDLTNQEEVDTAVEGYDHKGVDIILHIAGVIPPKADKFPETAEAVNVEGTKNILNAVKKLQKKQQNKQQKDIKIIYTSSISVYGDRVKNPWIKVGDVLNTNLGDYYGRTKIKAENLIQESGLNWTIFRLSYITIPERKLNAENLRMIFYMPLDTSIEILRCVDIGYALAQAIDCEELIGHIYNVAGGEKCRTIYGEYLQKYLEIFGLGNNTISKISHAFATKNFHCGYYSDTDDLQQILKFQRNTLEDHFNAVKAEIGPFKKFFLRFVRFIRPLARWFILKHSEPLKAKKNNDRTLIEQYFGN